jgi:Ca2+-binding EF-hand superfamily protein
MSEIKSENDPLEEAIIKWRTYFLSKCDNDDKKVTLNALETEFKKIDKNGDGRIQAVEFALLINSLRRTVVLGEDDNTCPFNIPDSEVPMLFDILDEDQDGCLDVYEFINSIRGRIEPIKQLYIDYVFEKLDSNADGYIEFDELIAWTTSPNFIECQRQHGAIQLKAKKIINYSSAREFINNFDQAVDGPKDGRVSRFEFNSYYNNMCFEQSSSTETFVQSLLAEWAFEKNPAEEWVQARMTERAQAASVIQRRAKAENGLFKKIEVKKRRNSAASTIQRGFQRRASVQIENATPPDTELSGMDQTDGSVDQKLSLELHTAIPPQENRRSASGASPRKAKLSASSQPSSSDVDALRRIIDQNNKTMEKQKEIILDLVRKLEARGEAVDIKNLLL